MDLQDLQRKRHGWLACVCVVWLMSCGEATSVHDVDTVSSDGCGEWKVKNTRHLNLAKPSVWLGGSDKDGATFVDWSDGTVKPLIISGPQGGQHIWVSVRARNVYPSKLRMAVQMFDAETCEVIKPGRVEITHTMNVKPDGTMEYTGIPAFVKFPCSIRGRRIHVHLDISDLYGVTAEDDAEITPYWDGWCPTDADAVPGGADATATGDDGTLTQGDAGRH
jgi:hypothetical protein